ncbi:15184_t:CDS:2, partial [Dentiscutata erythropus]
LYSVAMVVVQGQSSAIVGNRLYFLGSAISKQASENIFLDVTFSTLNTSNPPWSQTNSRVPTNSAYASACVGGPNNNNIYLLEHLNTTSGFSNYTIVYAFDTVNKSWSIPNISGIIPVRFFGSSSDGELLNDIYIFDTLKLTWTQGSNVNAPTPRADFTATLLNNGLIIYIGGDVDMFKIPIYNTNNDSWSTMIADGNELSPRSRFTAVLSPDGHVIIYGGTGPTDQTELLASLDTTVNPYIWSAKPMIGNNVPPPLVLHSAAIVDNFMIIAFGSRGINYDNSTFDINNLNTQLYLLDTRTYMWVTDTLQNFNSNISSNNTHTLSAIVIVAISIASIVLLEIVGLIIYLLYKRSTPSKFPNMQV